MDQYRINTKSWGLFFGIVFLNQIEMYLRSTNMNLVFLPN